MGTNESLIPLKRVSSIIFDIDGTLIDSNDQHAKSWHEAFHEYNINIEYENIRKLIGMGSEYILAHVLNETDFKSKGNKINEKRKEIFKKEYLNKIKPFPGITPLFERIKTDNKKIVLGTSSGKDIIDSYLEKLNVNYLIEGVVTDDDVTKAKPSPDTFITAAEKYDLNPNETIAVGDSPYDIIAANRFNIPIITVLTGHYKEVHLRELGAKEVWRNLEDLFLHYDSSIISK